MSQKVEITPELKKIKEVIKQVSTDDNVQLFTEIFFFLVEIWRADKHADKRLIQVLIIVITSVLAFLAAGRALVG